MFKIFCDKQKVVDLSNDSGNCFQNVSENVYYSLIRFICICIMIFFFIILKTILLNICSIAHFIDSKNSNYKKVCKILLRFKNLIFFFSL